MFQVCFVLSVIFLILALSQMPPEPAKKYHYAVAYAFQEKDSPSWHGSGNVELYFDREEKRISSARLEAMRGFVKKHLITTNNMADPTVVLLQIHYLGDY